MLVDSHTHTHFAAFQEDYKEVIGRALKADISIINVGTQKDTSRRAVEVAHEFPARVFATVGLHPIHTEKSYHDAQELGFLPQTVAENTQTNADSPRLSPTNELVGDKSVSSPRPTSPAGEFAGGRARESVPAGFTSRNEEFDYDYYRKLALDPKVVAIGECGLDYYRVPRTHADHTQTNAEKIKERQKEVFLEQVKLAQEVDKPLMIHCRSSKGTDDAYEDLLKLLYPKPYTPNPISIVHFYAGGVKTTEKLLNAGFYFTFGGVITLARDYDEQIKMIPLKRILLETDAPYVAPESYRGKRNEPSYIIETAKKMAEIKGASYENVCAVTSENAKRVFKI